MSATTNDVRVRPARGDSVDVKRDDIEDIDHPGTTAMTVGAVLAGTALALATYNATRCESGVDMYSRDCQAVGYLFAIPPVVVGSSLLLWGTVTHEESKGRLVPRSPAGGKR